MKKAKNDFVLGKNDVGNAFSKIKRGETNFVLGKRGLGRGFSFINMGGFMAKYFSVPRKSLLKP